VTSVLPRRAICSRPLEEFAWFQVFQPSPSVRIIARHPWYYSDLNGAAVHFQADDVKLPLDILHDFFSLYPWSLERWSLNSERLARYSPRPRSLTRWRSKRTSRCRSGWQDIAEGYSPSQYLGHGEVSFFCISADVFRIEHWVPTRTRTYLTLTDILAPQAILPAYNIHAAQLRSVYISKTSIYNGAGIEDTPRVSEEQTS
jgi:hypothetical protein